MFATDIDYEHLTAEGHALPEPERHALPDDFEDLRPGLFKAAITSSVDRSRLNGHDAVRLMKAEKDLASHFEAGSLATMAEAAHSPGGSPQSRVERDLSAMEYAADEISAALSLTRHAAERDLDLALSLTGRLRRVWQTFSEGRIDLRKVRILEQQLGHLSNEIVDQILERVLDQAGDLTTGQLRARLARLVMELHPEGVEVGYRRGIEDRKLVSYGNPDHTATTAIQSMAPQDSAAISARVRWIAMSLKRGSDPRSLDQICADVAIDLLLGRADYDTGGGGGAHLNVDLATLAELSNAPGELAGYGPVIADIARQAAQDMTGTEWTCSVTDEGGEVVATGITRRRPTASQRRSVEARYQTCTFPGCRMPAYDCDLDHRKPFSEGGPTHEDNPGHSADITTWPSTTHRGIRRGCPMGTISG